MADEAFALSPITARPAQPSEADYDAIREAFMETSRGRWFLGEYAKRNRNADTRMVLDAVARIEETLASQRQSVADRQLLDMLAAIRSAVEQAEQAADAALDGLKFEDSLAPINRGVRIIKEISWRWREIGADGRICDLIDSQVGAIEAACGQIAGIDARAALNTAFGLIKARIDGFGDGADAGPPTAEATAAPSAVPVDEAPPARAAGAPGGAATAPQASAASITAIEASGATETIGAEAVPAATAGQPDAPAVDTAAIGGVAEARAALAAEVPVEPADVLLEPLDVAEEAGAAPAEAKAELPPEVRREVPFQAHADDDIIVTPRPAEPSQEAETVDDEAVLKLVAIEMAAPDADEIEFRSSLDDDIYVTRPLIEPMLVVNEPVAAPSLAALPRVLPEPPPARAAMLQAVPEAPVPAPAAAPAPEGAPQMIAEPSLGSTILANGLLPPSRDPASDPLAPIRRMSQAEKIALFS